MRSLGVIFLWVQSGRLQRLLMMVKLCVLSLLCGGKTNMETLFKKINQISTTLTAKLPKMSPKVTVFELLK